ncbi:MAG: NeuD/PglB/VioB family sugar acetyltransferase [Chitinophagaceae bacterium]
MVIIGAKGFAAEVYDILMQQGVRGEVAFFDNVNADVPDYIYDERKVLRDFSEVSQYFGTVSNEFLLGVGYSSVRKMLYSRFTELGGIPKTLIANQAYIGKINTFIGNGVNIMAGATVSSNVVLMDGVLINFGSNIAHDCIIGKFVEISPGVNIAGHCVIEEGATIGTGASLIPKIRIGKGAVVAAGAVVTKSVPENVMVAGVPAVIKKKLAI